MAKKLGIKYSTAKTLVRNYRGIYEFENKELVRAVCLEYNSKRLAKKRCGYISIETKQCDLTPEGSSECSVR